MTSIISQIVCGTRNLLAQGFRSLPVLLSSTILVLGMAQGNINLLFFFVGLAILSPTACLLVNLLWELIFSNTPSWLTIPSVYWKVSGGDSEQCNLFTLNDSSMPSIINVVPSYWLTIMAFFFTYLISNASSLYKKQENSKAPKSATEARKFQTLVSIVLLSACSIIFTILRFATQCETPLGVIISWVLGGYLGYGWYTFMRGCGLGRLDDIFGISNRLLPLQSYEEPMPTMCVPSTA